MDGLIDQPSAGVGKIELECQPASHAAAGPQVVRYATSLESSLGLATEATIFWENHFDQPRCRS